MCLIQLVLRCDHIQRVCCDLKHETTEKTQERCVCNLHARLTIHVICSDTRKLNLSGVSKTICPSELTQQLTIFMSTFMAVNGNPIIWIY